MNKEMYDLTSPQKSIWLTEQYYKNTNINNVCGIYLTSVQVDLKILEKAIKTFVKNNKSFRIKLDLKNGQVKQYFDDYSDFEIKKHKIKSEKDMLELANKVNSKGFEMLESFLFSFTLFEYPDKRGGFVVNCNHIISDSWTSGIIANEISEIYHKIELNEDISKNDDLSYLEYIKTEQEYINSAKFLKDKEYWDNIFETIPEVATIPSIQENSSNNITYLADRYLLDLPSDLFTKLKEYTSKNKISLYNLFMGVYALYLGRVSNLDDFVIGTPILNRTNFKEKQTTGMFINVLPLKFHLDHNQKFTDFISKVAVDSMGLLRHQRYSYNYILEDIRKKDSSNPGLYNVLFSYQITKMNETNSCLPHRTSWVFNESTLNDIDIHVFEWNDSDTIEIAYDYKKEKYSKEDISSIHERILHVFNQIIENENILLKEIEIVTPEEKHQILYEFNNTKADYPKDKTIAELFEEQVNKTPDNIAVVFEDQKLTYKELNEKANQLANYLVENGVKEGDIVGILVNRSLEMIVSILAILKSGGAYLPIDPEYPQDRINYMLNNSNAKLLLSFKTLSKIVKFKNTTFVEFSNKKIYDSKSDNLKCLSKPDSLAYLIYTSGSTGNPKGVMISHKNINNFINGMSKKIDFSSNKTIVSVTTISFDIFVLESLLPLTKGLRIVLANEKEQNNTFLFDKLCAKNKVNILQTTPSRMKILFSNNDEMKSLKYFSDILVGGEALSKEVLKLLKEKTSAKIYNVYGPTETTVWSTVKDMSKQSEISIGTPISNTQCLILDNNKNLLPIKTPGELCIGGDGLAHGYYNLDSLTNEKFETYNNKKIYKTGDLAYFDKNGELFHLGRSDFQIKLNGYRIELQEISSVILSYPKVIDCVVVPFKSENTNRLSVYYISNSIFDISELKKFLAQKLPSYMIPQFYTKIKEFPYTPNGKIDIKKLPNPDLSHSKIIVKPRNKTDILLINILKDLLEIKKISMSDSFFDIGGDSLSAINLCTKIYQEFNVQIFVKDIIKNQTIASLSDFISLQQKDTPSSLILKRIKEKSSYNISSAQKSVYLATSLDSQDSLLYNLPGGVILDKNPNIKKLEKCFKELIKRHESFRTYFEVEDDVIVQKIIKKLHFNLEISEGVFDLSEEFKDFVRPFDLSHAPLLRARLIKLASGKSALFVDMHHIISDGTSLTIFIDELCKLYNGKKLEKIKFTYKDFSSWENKAIESGIFEDAKKYWINQFEGEFPVLNMPTNYTRPAVKSYSGNKVHSKIDAETNKKIDSICKELGTTPYMLLLSIYYILLYKYTGQDDIIVGSPIVGRNFTEVYNIIGMFVNTLPVRAKVDSSLSFRAFLDNIKNICLKNYNYQDYPLNEIINNLNIPRDTSRSPLFDTLFTYQNNGYSSVNFHGINSKLYIPDTKISKFDLSLEVVPENGFLNLNFEYCTKLFNKPFIEDFAEHYKNILNAILENVEIQISKINMLSEKEKNKILYEFNNTAMDYPKNKTITELFEKQVEKTPDNIAVVFEGKKLTYRELNNKANSLAHYLRNQGINRCDIVGIMVNRSLEMIIAILAVLKAGGTYIPIDPDYPGDRIKYMLDNSNARLLLTFKRLDDIVKFNNKIYIELNNDSIYSLNNSNLNNENKPDDPFYIIYTSGSTGTPKGVILKHKAVTNLYYYLINTVDFLKQKRIQKRVVSVTTVSFDIFIFETILCLTNGLYLVICNEEEQHLPHKLFNLIQKENIEILQMTPSRMQIFLDNLTDTKNLSSIKNVVLAGEALPTSLVQKLKNLGVKKVYNGYGPSETTIFSTFTDVTDLAVVNIGIPLANTQIYILDNNKNLCPINVPGEIYISGDGVGIGYLNNAKLTDKSFLTNPFKENSKMYKTGDFCKFLPSGEIEYIERIDNQVKIRGLRIELGEIESKISSFPGIKKSCVIKQTINNRDFLSSYFTINKKIIISELRKYLSISLPKYMIPSYFTILDEFPYTPNGKIDKKSLPIPNEILSNSSEEYIAPKTNLQKKLVKIFEQILNINPIGINDNFFELGGDSILAMNLNIELKKITDKISYADIFKFPTIKQIEEKIKAEIDNFDFEYMKKNYNKYNNLLYKNISVPNKYDLKYHEAGNILLTGATGFLGIHILESFIKNEKGNIYCIVRDERGLTSNSKLQQKLHYYFDNKYDNLIGKRIITVTGDITKPGFGLEQEDLFNLANNVDIIINSAGKVSHFRKLC